MNRLSYDQEDGSFTWKIRENGPATINTRIAGKAAGTITPFGYRSINLNGSNYLCHRLAWLIITGDWPENEIDHKDGDPLNNSWSNLRAATKSQNMANSKGYGKSGFKGVSLCKRSGKWRATIYHAGKWRDLGKFSDPEIASQAYKSESERIHGEYASHINRDCQ